jgi:hypothetical protein
MPSGAGTAVVPRQLGERWIGVGTAERLERHGNALVQPRARGGKQLAVQRFAHQRVREAEATHRCGLLDQAGGGGGGKAGEHVLGCKAGGFSEQDRVELAPDHRCQREQVPIFCRQRFEPPAQGRANALRKRQGFRQHRLVVEVALTAGDAQHLVEEEGVAIGQLVKPRDEGGWRRRRGDPRD